MLENSDILKEIPLLNNVQLHDITDKQLVRFRGMVQDMYDPEYFFKQYEVKNTKTGESDIRCGMYTDAARCLVIHFLVLSLNIFRILEFLYIYDSVDISLCCPYSYMNNGYNLESRLKVICNSGMGCYKNSLSHV